MRLTPNLHNNNNHNSTNTNSHQQHAAADAQQGGDSTQQQLLKRHSMPATMRGGLHTQHPQQQRSLASRPSVVPGPSYPFPSQTQLPSSRPGGLWHSVLKPFRRARQRVQGYTFLDWLQLFLPCVRWLRTYRIKEFLLWDIIAGISVGFMVVPQGMSYANIAGVPSVFGLYGAFLPVLVYAVFGSSRELAVGPVAVTSLLISSSLKEVVPGSADITNPNNPPAELVAVQELYNHRAIQLSLLVACMYTAVGVFNLGFLTNFLSHSVIGGFTSGAAIIIGMSQLKYLLGYNVPRADKLYEQIHLYIEGIHGFVWQEYVMGVSLLTMLLTIKFYGKRYPRLKWLRPLGPISACVIAIIAVVAGNLQDKGIKIVGHIPAGLPSPTVSYWMPMDDAARLAPLALVVMVVDLLESTSIARALAAKGKYELSANQEIVGLGLANFAGSAFHAYSTTGSFSRSAVNYDSGCKTGLSGFVTGCVVGLVLLVMTPVFEKLPLNVMGAIVISGVSGLFEYEEAVHLFKVRKLDFCVWMCSFLSTMFLGVEIGLAISIGLALMIVIYESAFPHTALLGRVGRTTIYRNVKQFPDSQVIPGIAACRVDAAMYFANVAYIHERLRKYVLRADAYSEAAGTRLQYLLLDMSPVTHLDTTGASLLEKLHEELQHQGIQLGLCNPACAVVALLERTGFPDQLGREWIFVRMHDAVQTCLAAMISDGQAVRPLSAYDSKVITPRMLPGARGGGPGPGPLLFHPPGRHYASPSPRYPRHSAPGSGVTGLLAAEGGRHSFDGSSGGDGRSPLLAHKHGGTPHSRGGVAGAAGLGSSAFSGRGLDAAEHNFIGASSSPRIGTGTAVAAGAAGAGYVDAAGHPGSRVRSESAPGFRGGTHEQQQQHLSAGLLDSHRQQPQHQQPYHHHTQWAAAGAVASAAPAAAGVGHSAGPHPDSVRDLRRLSSTTGAALRDAALLVASQDSAAAAAAGLPAAPAGLPRLFVHTTSSASHRRSSADGSTGGGVAPVSLGGMQLHISPQVLQHPALLSRSASISVGGGDLAPGAATPGQQQQPLSSGSSFRRPVSPRTERLLDDVFSASNGDEPLLLELTSAEGSGQQMLQLSEMQLPSEDTWGAVGLRMPLSGTTTPQGWADGATAAGAAAAAAGAQQQGAGGREPARVAAEAGAAASDPALLGEVRLLLGHPGATSRAHAD